MPTYVAFGKDFGITLDAEPEEVASKLSVEPPRHFVQFQGTQQSSVYGYFVNGGGVAYIVRVSGSEEEASSGTG